MVPLCNGIVEFEESVEARSFFPHHPPSHAVTEREMAWLQDGSHWTYRRRALVSLLVSFRHCHILTIQDVQWFQLNIPQCIIKWLLVSKSVIARLRLLPEKRNKDCELFQVSVYSCEIEICIFLLIKWVNWSQLHLQLIFSRTSFT